MASSRQLFWLVDLTLDVYDSIWSLAVPKYRKAVIYAAAIQSTSSQKHVFYCLKKIKDFKGLSLENGTGIWNMVMNTTEL